MPREEELKKQIKDLRFALAVAVVHWLATNAIPKEIKQVEEFLTETIDLLKCSEEGWPIVWRIWNETRSAE